MTDAYYQRLRSRDPHGYEDLVARAKPVRTPDRAAAVMSTAAGSGAAPQEPSEPARSHSAGPDQRRRREVFYPWLKG